ncbi:MAG: HEAT repeat domain-containing protein [Spirulinaceae cyanobacterium]
MDKSISQLIKDVDQADSALGLLKAVAALAKARDEEAIGTLIEVLGFNNPGAAVAAVEGLIVLGKVAVPSLLEQLDGYNYGARAWAIRALAAIGDPRALDTLLSAAKSDFSQSVRRSAARGLGIIEWSEVEATEVQSKQNQVLQTLLQVCQDVEWVVRYGAVVGLESLSLNANSPEISQEISAHLTQVIVQDSELIIQARANLALSKLEKKVLLSH